MLYAISCHGDRTLNSESEIETNRIQVPHNMKFISFVETGNSYSMLLSYLIHYAIINDIDFDSFIERETDPIEIEKKFRILIIY